MVSGDIEDLAELYRQFWDEKSEIENMQNIFKELEDNDHYIQLSALKEGNLVGSILGIVCESLYGKCEPFLVIEDFIVDKNYRHQGIGTALIEELEKRVKQKGCSYVILVTEKERKGAISFYESVGFKKGKHQGFKKKI